MLPKGPGAIGKPLARSVEREPLTLSFSRTIREEPFYYLKHVDKLPEKCYLCIEQLNSCSNVIRRCHP